MGKRGTQLIIVKQVLREEGVLSISRSWEKPPTRAEGPGGTYTPQRMP